MRPARKPKGWFGRFHAGFERGFERLRSGYRNWLNACLHHRRLFAVCFLAFCAASCLLTPFLGEDFFPKVDAGQMRLHVRAKTGTRVEETAAVVRSRGRSDPADHSAEGIGKHRG